MWATPLFPSFLCDGASVSALRVPVALWLLLQVSFAPLCLVS